ncbi:AMP-binding protein [Streptomyces sp. SCUT-3]|nr:AMP-binding protein [Streptomyces sp. SCUT-3]
MIGTGRPSCSAAGCCALEAVARTRTARWAGSTCSPRGARAALTEWKRGREPGDRAAGRSGPLRRAGRRTPDAVALTPGTSGSPTASWTSAPTGSRTGDRPGRGPGDRVAVLLERSAESVVSVLAVLKAGGAYVPLDPLPAGRLRLIMSQTAAAVLLTDRALRDTDIQHEARILVVDDTRAWPTSPPRTRPSPATPSSSPTSCTLRVDRRAKGVGITHGTSSPSPSTAPGTAATRSGCSCTRAGLRRPTTRRGCRCCAAAGSSWRRRRAGRPRPGADHRRGGHHRPVADRRPVTDHCRGVAGVLRARPRGVVRRDVVPSASVRRVLEAAPGVVVGDGYGPTETTTFATRH